jgi:hypothetical protein
MNAPFDGMVFVYKWIDPATFALMTSPLTVKHVDHEQATVELADGRCLTLQSWEDLTKLSAAAESEPILQGVMRGGAWDAPPSSREVKREPLDVPAIHREIDDIFTFNPPLTQEQFIACQQIQNACRTIAHVITEKAPEGREQIICTNSLLSVALFARQAITRRQVVVMSTMPPEELPPSTPPATAACPEDKNPENAT